MVQCVVQAVVKNCLVLVDFRIKFDLGENSMHVHLISSNSHAFMHPHAITFN